MARTVATVVKTRSNGSASFQERSFGDYILFAASLGLVVGGCRVTKGSRSRELYMSLGLEEVPMEVKIRGTEVPVPRRVRRNRFAPAMAGFRADGEPKTLRNGRKIVVNKNSVITQRHIPSN